MPCVYLYIPTHTYMFGDICIYTYIFILFFFWMPFNQTLINWSKRPAVRLIRKFSSLTKYLMAIEGSVVSESLRWARSRPVCWSENSDLPKISLLVLDRREGSVRFVHIPDDEFEAFPPALAKFVPR